MNKQQFKNLCSTFRLAIRNGLAKHEALLWIGYYNKTDKEILVKVYGE